jgi:hypothetical protein
MDPYLENPRVWPGVHRRLCVRIADDLQARLRPRYVTSVGERVYLEEGGREIIPDAHITRKALEQAKTVAVLEVDEPVVVRVPGLEVHEWYIEILDLSSNQRVVTIIELVSPTNKAAGPGRESYLKKQREVRASDTHLVEIDLLRGGGHVLAVPREVARAEKDYDYLVCVNRAAGIRDEFDIYPRTLRERLPRIGIPLAAGERDVACDLQAALEKVYDAGGYDLRIDYAEPSVPRLSSEDAAWANDLIRRWSESARE